MMLMLRIVDTLRLTMKYIYRSAATLRSKDIDPNTNETTNETDMNDLTVNPETNTNIESDPIIRKQ